MKKSTKSMVMFLVVVALAVAGYYLYKKRTEAFKDKDVKEGFEDMPFWAVFLIVLAVVVVVVGGILFFKAKKSATAPPSGNASASNGGLTARANRINAMASPSQFGGRRR